MIRPADSDEEKDKEEEDDGKTVAVKDDPQFTLTVTRGQLFEVSSNYKVRILFFLAFLYLKGKSQYNI